MSTSISLQAHSNGNILLPGQASSLPETLQEYERRGGYRGLKRAHQHTPEQIVQMIVDSGLRGRGGACFPSGRKWQLAAEASGSERVVVVNGGEDEPGSFKDRYLMEHHPHLVLEGALIAARALGAGRIFLYVNESFEASRSSLTMALRELEQNCVGGEQGPAFSMVAAPQAYVAGEDSAVLEVLEGKKPVPRSKPPYPVTAGFQGLPTLVHNVETVASVGFILRMGPEAFRRVGTPESPGTMLFYLNQEFSRPGIYELPLGTALRHLVGELGGGLESGEEIQAILPGGPSTAFLPARCLDLALAPETLQQAGSGLGCGNVRLIPVSSCIVEETLKIAEFFARESCGKCPQCQMETQAFVTLLRKVRSGEGSSAMLEQVETIAKFSSGKGDCSLIRMAAAPVLSAVRLFRSHFERHLEQGGCELRKP